MAHSSTSRPTSPTMQQLLSFRLMNSGDKEVLGDSPGISRRSSIVVGNKGKGKDRAVDEPPASPSISPYTFISRPQSSSGFSSISSGMDSAPTSPNRQSTSNSKRSSIISSHSTSSSRSSILDLAASASPFKFGRKRKSLVSARAINMRIPGMNVILPDVLEISAATVATHATEESGIGEKEIDEETRERDRLREEAAQALGLGSGNSHVHSRVDAHSVHDDDDRQESVVLDATPHEDDIGSSQQDQESLTSARTSESAAPNPHSHFSHSPHSPTFSNHATQPRSPLTSTASLAPPPLPSGVSTAHGRNRSGSMPAAFTFHTPSQTHVLPLASSHSLGPNGYNAQSHTRASSISVTPGLPITASTFKTDPSSSSVPEVSTPISITPVPPFPSTPAALKPFIQTSSSSTLSKYYPTSSLRIFALGKQWKSRHLVLSSPIIDTAGGQGNSISHTSGHTTGSSHSLVSYLHLFKTASPDDRELERLEINEDSAVFVAEEDVGGRKSVVKVRGKEVGSEDIKRKEGGSRREKDWERRGEITEGDPGDGPMWFLQIPDSAEKQRWIESVKNKIFGQRTMRAGLGPSSPNSSSFVEPRGDMDVMMSIRAQGILGSSTVFPTSPVRNTFNTQDAINYFTAPSINPASPPTPTALSVSHNQYEQYAASVSSMRSYNVSHDSHVKHTSSSSTHGLGALKGLFIHSKASGRPRSSSCATSIVETEAGTGEDTHSREAGGIERVNSTSSVNTVGHASVKASKSKSKTSNLMSILRSSTAESLTGIVGSGSSGAGPVGGDARVHNAGLSMGIHTPTVDFRSFAISRLHQSHPSQLERKIIEDPTSADHKADDENLIARPLMLPEGTLASSNSSSTLTHASSIQGGGGTRNARAFSVGDAFSLQPPPRKRWTSASGSGAANVQDSPFVKDHHALSDIGVLGGNPSIPTSSPSLSPMINTAANNGKLSPEPLAGSSTLTTRRASTSGGSAFSFSIGTPPGSGHISAGQEREYRPGSRSSRSVRSGRSVFSGRSASTTEDKDDEMGEYDPREAGELESAEIMGGGRISNGSHGNGNTLSSDGGERRASFSSAKRSSGAKRWSRQLPKRLTPPSGPPPAVPSTPSTPSSTRGRDAGERTSPSASKMPHRQAHPHPYSGASSTDNHDRSNHSPSSRPSSSRSSVISNLPSFSKRASASSALSNFSVNTGSTSHSHVNGVPVSAPVAGTVPPMSGVSGHVRSGSSSHRASMPPPPRPAPTFALPPAPMEEPSSAPVPTVATTTSNRPSFRESVAARALRLSLMAPKPPPVTVLPPRPDETEQLQSPRSSMSKTHRRSPSGSSRRANGSGGLYSIPGSPVPPSSVQPSAVTHPSASPFPPPVGPLPPTPTSSPGTRPPLPPSRGASIKQRLRILSAPSMSSSSSALSQSIRSPSRPTTMVTPSATSTTTSPPGTPIQAQMPHIEKASFMQDHNINRLSISVNDPSSFLSLATPVTPSLPTPKIHTLPPPEPEPELTSLSPPPRRGSKRISLPEVEPDPTSAVIQQEDPPVSMASANEGDSHDQAFSLSRHGSVVSLGLVDL